MMRNQAVAALSGIAVLALAACSAAPASQPSVKTAATHAAQTGKPDSTNPAWANKVPARMSPTNVAPTIKAPGETIPARATTVTLTLKPDVNAHVKPPHPDTVTNPVKIRQLTALINGLPAFPAGIYSCPFDGGGQLVLTFRAAAAGTALAVATINLEGCEGVNLTVAGRQQSAVGKLDGGRPTATQALKIAGLNWKLPA
jgi:lipoprotein-anchoring transpeptidase ErfK/SrfK